MTSGDGNEAAPCDLHAALGRIWSSGGGSLMTTNRVRSPESVGGVGSRTAIIRAQGATDVSGTRNVLTLAHCATGNARSTRLGTVRAVGPETPLPRVCVADPGQWLWGSIENGGDATGL